MRLPLFRPPHHPFRTTSSRAGLRGVGLCLLSSLLLNAAAQAQPAEAGSPEGAPQDATPVAVAGASPGATVRAGSSDSGELYQRLRFRVERALSERLGERGAPGELGPAGGFHWIILMQSARYPDSNVRFTDMRRGVQSFLQALAEARRSRGQADVSDTISLIPYHFNILGTPRERLLPLREFLQDPKPLKARVPGAPLADIYQKSSWQDGHDWRSAMEQALEWAKRSDVEVKHAIFIVLDWNDLAQAPNLRAEGTRAQATGDALVLPQNKALYAKYLRAMSEAGLDGTANLETVQVGNIEYDMAVLSTRDLQPLPSAAQAAPAAQPTAAPTPCPPGTTASAQGTCIEDEGSGAGLLLFLIPLGGAAFLALRPRRVQFDSGHIEALRAVGRDTLDIVIEGGGSSARPRYVLPTRGPSLAGAPSQALARVKLGLPDKIVVSDGAFKVSPLRGFKPTAGGHLLTGRSGDFALLSNNQQVAVINIKRL